MSERDPHTHGPLINNNSKEATQCKEARVQEWGAIGNTHSQQMKLNDQMV